MKLIITVAMMAGILTASAELPAQTKPSSTGDKIEFAAHPEVAIAAGIIATAPSNYVGTVVNVSGKITKLETEGSGGDSFLVVVDSLLEAHVNARVMLTASFDSVGTNVVLYRPPTGTPMLCAGPPATSYNNKQSSGPRLFGIGDDVIVRGTLRKGDGKLVLDATSFRMNSNPTP